MLDGKYGISMLTFILAEAVTFLLGLPFVIIISVFLSIESLANGTPLNEDALSIAIDVIAVLSKIIGGIFRAGITLYYLNIACGKRYSISDLFFGFRWQFKKTLALSAIFIVLNEVCLLPYNILYYQTQNSFVMTDLIPLLIAYCVGLVVQLPFTLMLSQTFYLLLDFPQLSAKQLMKQSIRIMKGHKKRLLYIQLSFLPLWLLSICSCFIGFLWLVPYQQMTYSLFFLDIMNPRKASEQNITNYS